MLVKLAEETDGNPAQHVFQSAFWAYQKEINGWSSRFLTVEMACCETGEKETFSLLVLLKPLFKHLYLAYIPYGPPEKLCRTCTGEMDLQLLSTRICELIPWKIVMVRYDLPFAYEKVFQASQERLIRAVAGERRAFGQNCILKRYAVQPAATVVIPLAQPENELYRQFRKRAKRHIRQAEKQVEVETHMCPVPVDILHEWYAVYAETAKRDGFAARSEAYFSRMLCSDPGSTDDHPDRTRCLLITAREKTDNKLPALHPGRLAAGIVVLFNPYMSLYLAGASLRENWIGCSPSYLLQWKAILSARTYGCRFYDFHGIALNQDRRGFDAHLRGLNTFKHAFGGVDLVRPGTVDVPCRPAAYSLFSVIEFLRIVYYRKIRPLCTFHAG